MGKRELHAIVYKDARSESWVAACIEYDIATMGDSEEHALEMIQEAVELHFEDITKEQLDTIDNEVGSVPSVKKFAIRAPALLDS